MHTSLKLAMAVGATLAAGSAFALNPAATVGAQVKLVVAGASAYRDTFAQNLAPICQDTVDRYVSSTQDFRAYSCTLNDNSGLAAGTTAVIYYRSTGGSVYGVGTIAKNAPVKRLLVDTDCTLTGTNVYSCTVTGFNLAGDTATEGLVSDTVQLGVSDVEPAQFLLDANWPNSTIMGAKPSKAQMDTVTPQAGNGVTFGVYVNKSNADLAANATNLSKQTLTSIFSGVYTNWNKVPKADGSGPVTASSVPITVCRREEGSGTHATVNIFFLGAGCSSASYSFRNVTAFQGDTAAELTCVNNAATPGAIGYASLTNLLPSTGTQYTNTMLIQIDGRTASKDNAAKGIYDYWFENTFNSKDSVLDPNSNPGILAQTLINRAQDAATINGASLNTFALPVGVNSATLPITVSPTGTPTSIGYRSGNSCFLPQGQN